MAALHASTEDFFWDKVDKDGPLPCELPHLGKCWLWTGYKTARGYGHFAVHRKVGNAHRYAYELLIGLVPNGLHLDHLCRNPSCVNPGHLEPVTPKENLRRSPLTVPSINAGKTHCPLGHPYDEANTCISPSSSSRECRACWPIKRKKYGKTGRKKQRLDGEDDRWLEGQ